MAWTVDGKDISTTKGDWGVALPITISGVTFSENDALRFDIKEDVGSEPIISLYYSTISQNEIELTLSNEDSEKLHIGTYYYNLDWFQDGAFMYNIIPDALFKVVAK